MEKYVPTGWTPNIPPETNWFEENGVEYPEPMRFDRRDDATLGHWIQTSLDVIANPDLYSEQYVAGHQHYLDRHRGIHGKRFKRIRSSLK